MAWRGPRISKMKETYRIFIGEHEAKRSPKRRRCGSLDNIKMDLRENRLEDSICRAKYRVQSGLLCGLGDHKSGIS